MTVGQRIRDKRISMNMSQDELGKRCGYKSRSSINKIELSRELPLSKVAAVAKALGCSPTELMGWREAELSMDNADALAQLMQDAALLEYVKKMMVMEEKKREAAYAYIDFLSSN